MKNQRILLFTYGTLRVGHRPPATLGAWWPDQVQADRYTGYEYPALVNVGRGSSLIAGQVLCICRSELESLDEYEETNLGIYRRIQVTTKRKFKTYIYEYCT